MTLENNAAVHQVTELAERRNPNYGFDQLSLKGIEAVTAEEGYCDPVKDGDCQRVKAHGGRWLAGIAAAGNTGFAAIVETLRDDTAHPNKTLVRRLLLWGGIPFAFCAALRLAQSSNAARGNRRSADVEDSDRSPRVSLRASGAS